MKETHGGRGEPKTFDQTGILKQKQNFHWPSQRENSKWKF